MAGEGFMQSTINSLRNNNGMLRKKSMFSRERSFLNIKKEYLKAAEGKLEFKEISKEELQLIRNRFIKNRKKEEIKAVIIFSTIALIFFSFLGYQYKIYSDKQNLKLEKQNLIKYTNDLHEYDYNISEGDKLIELKHWNNAIFRYKSAIEIFPKDFDANYRLALAYSYKCTYEKKDCEVGLAFTNELLESIPENKDLLILKNIFESRKL
jgi:hypothetical protein